MTVDSMTILRKFFNRAFSEDRRSLKIFTNAELVQMLKDLQDCMPREPGLAKEVLEELIRRGEK